MQGWSGHDVTSPTMQSDPDDAPWVAGFSEYLLAGIIALMFLGLALVAFLYLLPPERLQLAELQPAYVVAPDAQFPIGASRLIDWGDQPILVVRTSKTDFAGLQGVSPSDGCILQWDPTGMRVTSPCTYIVYDLHGNVVKGLTTVPLQRFPVFVRDSMVYVGRP